jgi:hypothetical protein
MMNNDTLQAIAAMPLSTDLIDEITVIVFGSIVEPSACDVIFIFGGSAPGLWQKGAEAYLQGLGRHIVVTGGYKPGYVRPDWPTGTREAHVICRELIKLGVSEPDLFYEDRSTNTLENVLFAKGVYDFTLVNRVLAVCKCYGAGRQCRTLKWNLHAGVQVVPYTMDAHMRGEGPLITRDTWAAHEQTRAFILEQAAKICLYGQRGHLEPITYLSPTLKAIIDVLIDKRIVT